MPSDRGGRPCGGCRRGFGERRRACPATIEGSTIDVEVPAVTSRPRPQRPGPGQESVWDYPRPPRLERTAAAIEVVLGGVVVAATRSALRVLETSHPPSYYLPPEAFVPGSLRPAAGHSVCEWKGEAGYLDVIGGDAVAERAAWTYPRPTPPFASAGRLRRSVPGPDGPLHGRRRGRAAAAGRLLRRLDHVGGRRPLQGRARHDVLVTLRTRGAAPGTSSVPGRGPPRPAGPPGGAPGPGPRGR